MKILPMMLLAALMLVPLDAEIAEITAGGGSLSNSYCTLTYSDGCLGYEDTSGQSATLVVLLAYTGDTEVTLKDGSVSYSATAVYEWGMCTAVIENVIPGTYTFISAAGDPLVITASPENGAYSATWSSLD